MAVCNLYRHFDDAGQLLYVGISLSALARLSSHRSSPWFDSISVVKIETLSSRSEALIAERKAIINEKPLHNKIHNDGAEQEEFVPVEITTQVEPDESKEGIVEMFGLPFLGTITNVKETEEGWTGISPNGSILNVKTKNGEIKVAPRVVNIGTDGTFNGWYGLSAAG